MSTTLKTAIAIAALIIATPIASAAGASQGDLTPQRTIFEEIRDTAPRSIFDQIRDTAPRTLFDQIQDSAPKTVSPFQEIADSAP